MKRLRSWSASLPSFGVLSRMVEFRPWAQAIGAALLLNLAVGAAWTYPRWQEAGPDREEARQLAEADELVGPALARARDTYGCILAAEEDLRSLHRLIATQSGTTAEAVETIRGLVDRAGLRVTRVTRQAEPIEELGVLELQTKLPVTGSYDAVRELIAALASEGPFVAIDRIALSAPEQSGSGAVAVELGLSTFVAEAGLPSTALMGNGPERNGPSDDRSLDDGAGTPFDDPWAVIDRVRERLASLPPLPVPPERYDVALSRLEGRPPAHDGDVSRNLFSFDSVARPAPTVEPPPSETRPTDPAPRPPPPPRVDYELLGILKMPDGRRATMKDQDGLFVVGPGERLPEGILVVAVGIDYVELEIRGVRVRLELEDGTP